MTTEIETYQNELAYHEMINTGVGNVSMPTTRGVMTADEIADYNEELMYSVELYGADIISRPRVTNKISVLATQAKDSIMSAITGDTAKSIGDKMRDWNDRLEQQEKKRPPLLPQ
jgi:hypothetical protein